MENMAAKSVGELMDYVQGEVVPEIRRMINEAAKANGAKGVPNFSLHMTGEGYATYNVYMDEGDDQFPGHLFMSNPFGTNWKRNKAGEQDPWEAETA